MIATFVRPSLADRIVQAIKRAGFPVVTVFVMTEDRQEAIGLAALQTDASTEKRSASQLDTAQLELTRRRFTRAGIRKLS